MANYRQIHTKVWADPDFETLHPNDKLLFIYLLSNSHRNESAVYTLTKKRMSDETGIIFDKLGDSLRRLSEADMVRYDESTSYIWVRNACKYQTLNENCLRSILNDLKSCSSPSIRDEFIAYYGSYNGLERVIKHMANPPIGIGIGIEECIGSKDKLVLSSSVGSKEKKDSRNTRKSPEGVDNVLATPGLWGEYEEHRRQRGKPLTAKASEMAIKKLERLSGGNRRLADVILRQTLEEGWLGIFEPRVQVLDAFRKSEQQRMLNRQIKCEHCGEMISERNRYDHQREGVCSGWRSANPAQVKSVINDLASAMRSPVKGVASGTP